MTTDRAEAGYDLRIAGLVVRVVPKDIRRVRLNVQPPDGRVSASVPRALGADAVRVVVAQRIGWIRRSQRAFAGQQRVGDREIVSGEGHHVDGRRRRLVVVEDATAAPGIKLRGGRVIEMTVRPGASVAARERLLDSWYRERLRTRLRPLITKLQAKVGVEVAHVGLRRMKTRWGSCKSASRRILLNPDLAKKSPPCLEYVLLHELLHLIEPDHGPAFIRRLTELMPRWRRIRDELQHAPLDRYKIN